MDAGHRARLREESAKRLESAAQALLADNPAAAQADLRWRAVAERLLRASAPPHPWRELVLIGLACRFLILLAWTWRTSDNPLRLEATAESVSLRLAQAWEVELDWSLAGLSLDNLRSIHLASGEAECSRMRLDGAGIRLRRLSLPAGALLELERGPDGLSLFVKNGELRGEVAVTEARAQLHCESGEQILSLQAAPAMPPEMLRFASVAAGEQGRPAKLLASSGQALRLPGLSASGLSFLREESAGSNVWVSTVIAAQGRFLEVERDFAAQAGDTLALQGLRSERLQLAADAAGLQLRLQGQVDRLSIGPTGFQRELAPT
jgi:hypothetical protein